MLERRQRVSEMYLQGKPQHEIAAELNLSPQTVYNYLKDLRDLWEESAQADFSRKKAQELAKLDRLEQVAWEAWERSKEDGELIRTQERHLRNAPPKNPKGGRPRKEPKNPPMRLIERRTETVRKGQDGDPRFLEQIGRCVELRLRLMGLLKGSGGRQGAPVVVNWSELHWHQASKEAAEADDPVEAEIISLKTRGNAEAVKALPPPAQPTTTESSQPTEPHRGADHQPRPYTLSQQLPPQFDDDNEEEE